MRDGQNMRSDGQRIMPAVEDALNLRILKRHLETPPLQFTAVCRGNKDAFGFERKQFGSPSRSIR